VIERATRFPSGTPVSSYIHYKSPNIVNRANNVLVDAQLSIQYFNHEFAKITKIKRSRKFHSLQYSKNARGSVDHEIHLLKLILSAG
jgi:hypothetical protein